MRNLFPQLLVAVLLVLTAGCATSVDMDSMNNRIDDNAARLATLEEAQAKQEKEAGASRGDKLKALQDEIEVLRKEFADSKWTVDELAEKVEAFSAYREEIEQFIAQYRKRGPEIDKALEEITNRLEADVRSLAEKLRKMLEDGP